eukprot:g38759.t1
MLARALAPLFYARISPLLFKHVIATDASEFRLGECYAPSSGILPASTLDMLPVRWFLSHQSAAGSLLILYTDSQVVLGAASKGRSSSRPLLHLLRRIASCLLASGSTIYLVHVPSGMNLTDAPSRARPALDEFWNFALHNFGLDELKDARGIDEAFSDWIYDLYISCSGRRRQTVINAKCALISLLPHLRGKLHMSSAAITGWARLRPPVKRPPITWELTCLLALVVVRSWDPLVGLGFLLAFGAYLCVGEVCALRKEDVVFPGDKRLGSTYKHVGVVLRTTKTGANKFARITNSSVITLLQGVLRDGRRATSLLINCSPSRFKAFFRTAKNLLGLHAVGTPHLLRHGAATRDLLDDVPIEDIMLRGPLLASLAASAAADVVSLYRSASADFVRDLFAELREAKLSRQRDKLKARIRSFRQTEKWLRR